MKIKYPELPKGYEWNYHTYTGSVFVEFVESRQEAILFGYKCVTRENTIRWEVQCHDVTIAKNLSKQQAVNFMANYVNLGMLHEDKVS